MWPDDSATGWDTSQWIDNTTYPGYGSELSNTPLTATASEGGGADRWTGWFQGLATTVVNYSIAKDARQSGVQPVQYVNGQPVQYRSGVSGGTVLVLAALGIGAALLMRKG